MCARAVVYDGTWYGFGGCGLSWFNSKVISEKRDASCIEDGERVWGHVVILNKGSQSFPLRRDLREDLRKGGSKPQIPT